ncbi:hypothetical protein ACIQVL_20280 [Streptomyces sp. NPDC090499]|uniref:COG1470 family protein n=1 Tax=Streptomyces sp. NPDC090499 TaxID=3365965 RepID=UPI00381053FD
MITATARRLAALLLAVCALAGLPAAAWAAASSTPAASHGRTTFGIQPSGAKKPDRRPNLSYSVTPGAALRDHVAVWNYGTRPLTLRLYGGDAFITADGGFDVLAANRKSTAVGSWVRLGKGRVTVPGRSHVIVPFTLAVPRNVTPGDHAGGIVASLAATRTDAKGNKVEVDQRVGARIYLRVAGKLDARLSVDGPHTTYHGTLNPFGTGTATVTYTVRNTGNVRLGARQTVRVSDLFGGDATVRKPRDIPELLPGSALTVTASARGVLPTVRDTATVSVDPVPVRGDVPPPVHPRVTASAGFWAVPWPALGLILLVVAAVVVFFVRRRPRRRGTGAAGRRPVESERRRATAGQAAAMAIGTTAMVLAGASSARAADAGQLTVSPQHGSDTQPVTITMAEPCPSGTTNVIARVAGAGFPRAGQIVVGNAPLATYQKTPGGGASIPLIYTMRDYATTAGFHTLRGTYTFTLSCLKGAFSQSSVRDFSGSLRFSSNTAYRDGTKAKASAGVGAGAGAGASPSSGSGQAGGSASPGGSGAASGGSSPAVPNGGPAAPTAAAGGGVQRAAAPTAQHSNAKLIALSTSGFVVALLALLVGALFWVRGRRARAAVTSGSSD